MLRLPLSLVGDGYLVPCVDGTDRPYLSMDAAASTSALPEVFQRLEEFLPRYSSVHRGAGYKSQVSTRAYDEAHTAARVFAGREGRDDVAVFCRNTTEAINHLAYRLDLSPDEVVVTTVAEHHANLLPWRRYASCRYVECDEKGTFGVDEVVAALEGEPRPRLLAITGASNITGWSPALEPIIDASHHLGVPVLVDCAQLAPHRPMPLEADFIAWSGHKMYAPFGAGVLIGPSATFQYGEPFLAGGGAVELVDLDEVLWTEPPDREEAGSPNVVGAIALQVAMEHLLSIGWDKIAEHDQLLSERLRKGLGAIPGVRVLGPGGRSGGTLFPGESDADLLPVVTFTVDGIHHGLVAARLSAEFGIGVRHGCFCAHPYLMRLLGLSHDEVMAYRADVREGNHVSMPGAIRASTSLSTSTEDVDRLLDSLSTIAGGSPPPIPYIQDPRSGDCYPDPEATSWYVGGGNFPSCGSG